VVQVSLTAPYTKTEVGYNIGLGKVDTLSLYKSNNQNKQKGRFNKIFIALFLVYANFKLKNVTDF
jgi:hypothetical protein